MDMGIKQRVALITGASGGIGFATAQQLAEEGAYLVLSDKDVDQLKQKAKALPTQHLFIATDVTQQSDVDTLVKLAIEHFGKVDIVVHTAGITGAKGDPLELSDDDYLEAWQIDFLSAVHLARATIPAMRSRQWGRFVCITSENVVQPYWEEAVYNTAKAGLAAFIKGISYQEAKHGVLCNTVAPAYIQSNMTDGMMKQLAESEGISFDEAVKRFLKEQRPGIVQQRRGQPEEVAAAITLLVSERASFINGSNVRVDGGAVMSVQN